MGLVVMSACDGVDPLLGFETPGVDASVMDAKSHVVDAAGTDVVFGALCDAGVHLVELPQLPEFSCSPCPAAIPQNGDPCDAGEMDCEYGTDSRFGCNPIATCAQPPLDAGLSWHVYESQACGPAVDGPGCNPFCIENAPYDPTEPTCLSQFVIRDAGLGCPCPGPADASFDWEDMLCVDGRLFPLPPPPPPFH
jgi:hypothetical protein